MKESILDAFKRDVVEMRNGPILEPISFFNPIALDMPLSDVK